MIKGLFNSDNVIIFDPKKHIYTYRPTNSNFESVSNVLKIAKQPFNKEFISRMIANSSVNKHGGSIEEEQRKILSKWKNRANKASYRGDWLHSLCELFFRSGKTDGLSQEIVNHLFSLIKNSYRYYPEVICYSTKYKTSGRADLSIQRQRSDKSLFDFYDIKTNLFRGIEFDSTRIKDGTLKHYNQFLLPPLDHLESCNYNLYALQLSLYALLSQLTWGIRIGKLAIIYINKDLIPKTIPVPYLKLEALALLEHKLKLKKVA